jgi:hypothetical protein
MRRYLLALAVAVGGCLSGMTIQCSGLPNVYVDGEPIVIRGTLPNIIVIGCHDDDCWDD